MRVVRPMIFTLIAPVFLTSCAESDLDDQARKLLARELACLTTQTAQRRPYWHGTAEGCVDSEDKWHGPYRAFWRKGQKRAIGQFEHGRKTGKWKIWKIDGSLASEDSYMNNLAHGPCAKYVAGRKVYQGEHQKGLKHGRWIYFDDDGSVITEGDFSQGEKTGTWMTTAQKKPCEGKMKAGIKTGLWTCWHDSLRTTRWTAGSYIEGKEQGQWSVWHPNGQIKRRGEYLMGERHGMWFDWDEGGQKIGEYEYQNSRMLRAVRTKP